MPQLPTANAARVSLLHGAVGVGEHHDSDTARHHLYDWMLSGLVTQIVLELDDFANVPLGETVQVLGFIDNQWGNDIGLLDLWTLAENLNIEVRGWDPGDQLGLTMAQSLAFRNNQIVASFINEHAPGVPHAAVPNAVGVVLLFGVGHFGPTPMTINMLLGDALPWVDLH
ncbi:hypothetical protein KRR23_22235 [Pseudomonas sp. CVAP|uniref:hypothetical protein n=1 Tax=Pseudomonas sp. CVAP\|nr:hypothetical protein [Pseudomonas sp. CVAP\